MTGEPKKLVLATRNAGKIKEFERLLQEANQSAATNIHVLGLKDFPDMPDVEETGTTFEENSLLKSRAIAAYTGLPALADDSGLCIDVLGGAPGIYSARWAGEHGNDLANTAKVLGELAELDQRAGHRVSRRAQFVCVVSLVVPDRAELVVRGVMQGEIIDSPIGENGFGYDPIFRPDGYQVTSAQLEPEVKDAISHRGQALREILPQLLTAI